MEHDGMTEAQIDAILMECWNEPVPVRDLPEDIADDLCWDAA